MRAGLWASVGAGHIAPSPRAIGDPLQTLESSLMHVTTSRFSENVARVRPSATIAVAALARELRAAGRSIIDLSAGQPDFDTPAFVAEAGIEAIRSGRTRYAPAAGIPELRSAIARELSESYSTQAAPEGVVVTVGAKQALFNALFTLFGPGDRVLVPTPYWTSYPYLVHLARAEPVEVRGPEERGFKVGVAELEEAAQGARGLLLNSPTNPTGAVYGRDELRAILEWAAERDVWVISDEIYARVCFSARVAPGVLELDPALLERVVVVNGAAKSFAMTGWRIGFSYSHPEVAGRMAALQSHITTSAATPCQVAAAAAYGQSERREAAVGKMAAAFRARRDRLLRLFSELLPEVSYVRPEGAFYLFFRVDAHFSGPEDGSVELCRRILEEAEVALVPGAAFGDDRFVRLSFAASESEIEEGVTRLAGFLARVGST